MAHGIRIKNTATGSVQIDDLYENLALISKTTKVAGTTGVTGLGSQTFTYTSTNMPIVAFACTSPAFLSHVARDTGANTWTFTITAYSTGTVNITCYEFGRPPALGAGWGIRIQRGGVIKFDSRHKYARITTTLRGDTDVTVANGAAGPGATLAAGRTYAVVMGSITGSNSRTVIIQGGAQSGYTDGRSASAFGVSISGNVVSSQRIQTYFNSTFVPVPPAPLPGSGWNIQMTQYSWAILDVTGF